MADINSIGNLQRSGVKPLRGPKAKARANQAETERPKEVFSVEDLKKGGSLDLSAATKAAGQAGSSAQGQQPEAGKQSLRLSRYDGRKAGQLTDAQYRNSQLTEEEQIERLSKIRQSAVEYESVFVDQLVKQMRQSPLAKTPGGDILNGIAEQPFRDFLSQAGGLGLADSIVGQIARQEGLERTLHENPGIMGPNWRPSIAPNMMKNKAGQVAMPVEDKGPAKAEADGEGGRVKAPEAQAAESPAGNSGRAGLMDSEEIAWLYQDAAEALA